MVTLCWKGPLKTPVSAVNRGKRYDQTVVAAAGKFPGVGIYYQVYCTGLSAVFGSLRYWGKTVYGTYY